MGRPRFRVFPAEQRQPGTAQALGTGVEQHAEVVAAEPDRAEPDGQQLFGHADGQWKRAGRLPYPETAKD